MIQRIQSIYLALAGILLVLSAYQRLLLLLIINILALVTIVLAIFSYANRRKQIKLCNVALVFNIAWVAAFVTFYFLKAMALSIIALLPVVSIVLILLAKRAIKSDEELVRSADRIR